MRGSISRRSALKRLELETSAAFERWNISLLYRDYAAQPDIGFLARREGALGTVRVKLTDTLSACAGARYDLIAQKLNGTDIGIGYVDDCFALAVNYTIGYSYSGPTVVSNRQIMLQLSLRTLGTTTTTQTVGVAGANTGAGIAGGNGLF